MMSIFFKKVIFKWFFKELNFIDQICVWPSIIDPRRIVRRKDRASCERSIALTQLNEPVDCRRLTGWQRVIETRAAYKELRGLEE